MAQPLNSREMQLLVIATSYCKRNSDSNPEVGMGPSLGRLLDEVLCRCHITELSTSERVEVLRRVSLIA